MRARSLNGEPCSSGNSPESSPSVRLPTPLTSLQPLPLAQLPLATLADLPLAVVGHVEVVSFVGVPHLPAAGEILHAERFLELPAGGGAAAAVQLSRLSGERVLFFTALGRDAAGEAAAGALEELGLELQVAWRDAPTRRGISFSDGQGERTITVIGQRLAPTADDPLPWNRLAHCAGVYVTACDAAALRLARRAGVVTATPRLGATELQEAAVSLDALIGSARDPGERYAPGQLEPAPALYVGTEAAAGGVLIPGGRFSAPRRSGPVVDSYGAGDAFAAGLTAGLAADWPLEEAISLACHCGAACLDGFGPYASQLDLRGHAP